MKRCSEYRSVWRAGRRNASSPQHAVYGSSLLLERFGLRSCISLATEICVDHQRRARSAKNEEELPEGQTGAGQGMQRRTCQDGTVVGRQDGEPSHD